MLDLWVLVAACALFGLIAARILFARRPEVLAFADDREERLTRRLSKAVGCSPEAALPAVRQEIELAPGQSDETILKRATYHYQREAPEKTCSVFRDRAPG